MIRAFFLRFTKRERARKQLSEAQQAYRVCKARGDKRGQGRDYLRASHAMRDVLASEVGRGVFNIGAFR